MTKKLRLIIKITLILGFIVVSIAAVLCLTGVFNGKPANGKYYIVDNDNYKDAYVEIKGDQIQFHNIDLNEIYKERMIAIYEKRMLNHPEDKISEDEYDVKFNINSWLVEKPFTLDYEKGGKIGTFIHNYFLDNDFYYATVVIHYDSVKKTITLKYCGIEVKFAK